MNEDVTSDQNAAKRWRKMALMFMCSNVVLAGALLAQEHTLSDSYRQVTSLTKSLNSAGDAMGKADAALKAQKAAINECMRVVDPNWGKKP